MSEDKFLKAKSEHFKKRKKVVGYVALIIFAVLFFVAFAYLIVQFNSTRQKLSETATPSLQQPSIDANSATTPPSTTPQPADPAAPSATPQSAAAGFREQFIHALAQYESDAEPRIAALHLRDWDADTHAELQRLKARAIAEFADGEYVLARESLQRATAVLNAAADEHRARLDAAKREANEAFDRHHASEAQAAIARALRLSPDDAAMLDLQKRVAVLPKVLDLLAQADVAKTENRPEKEAAALQKLIALSPSPEYASRLAAVRAQLTRQRFSRALQKAHDALQAGELGDAQKQIARAQSLFANDPAIAPLQERLQRARTEKEFAAQTALGEQAVQRDDWPAAEKHFARALQLKANDKTAGDNHRAAQKVIAITRKINRALDAPHRLGDRAVLDSVAAYLREVESVVAVSRELRKSHAELARQVALYKTEVEVLVRSDNATYIIVRGEGQVGKTARRVIRLRPGKRVFEGTRRGYKSKLVTLNIKPGATSVEVAVICDEKI